MVHVLFVLYKNPPKSFLMYVIVIQTEAIYPIESKYRAPSFWVILYIPVNS